MSTVSKVILSLTAVMLIVNVSVARSTADWAVLVMIAVSASPALRPTRYNLILAVLATLASLTAQIAHSSLSGKIAIVCGVLCLVVALLNRALTPGTTSSS